MGNLKFAEKNVSSRNDRCIPSGAFPSNCQNISAIKGSVVVPRTNIDFVFKTTKFSSFSL